MKKSSALNKKYLDIDAFIDLMKEAKIVQNISDFKLDDSRDIGKITSNYYKSTNHKLIIDMI